ncbi:MAG: VCBS repeat-containing protein, partial [Candidatus Acidiferrum sp.]
MITLIATVQVGATALTLGQVNFCDAAAASCTDIHLLGTAQLTSAGTAILRFRPGSGSHSYKAVFLGTLAGAASSSAAVGLTVGPRPPGLQTTFTVAAVTGPDATNKYALTASVGTKAAIPPSGTVSFLDSDNGDSQLETAMLGPVSGGASFLNVPIPEPIGGGADAIPIVAIADFNGDGIPDVLSAPHGGIAISLGNGDGTFAAPLVPNLDAGYGINAFGVGDFNGDGITDLVVVDEDTGKLTVLLGNGDGTFAAG